MNISYTFQIYWDAKIDIYIDQMVILMKKYFENKNYSPDILTMGFSINCTPAITSNEKSKFYRKDHLLLLCTTLDYDIYMKYDENNKREYIASSILKDMKMISKFKTSEFDLNRMIGDFSNFFENIGWLNNESHLK